MTNLSRSQWLRYGVAVVSVGLATLLMLLLDPLLAMKQSPFLLFFGAVMVSAWYGGFRPGLLATVLSGFVSAYFFLPVMGSFSLTLISASRLGLFLLEGVLISLLSGALRTAKQRVERSLSRLQISEERYRRLVDTANEGIWVTDPQGRTNYVNYRLTQMLGYATEEVLNRTMLDFTEQPFPEAQPSLDQGIETRTQQDWCFRRKDGTVLWASVSTSPIISEAGQPLGILAMVMDVTQRKQAEEALKHSNRTIRNILESITDAFVAFDRQWRYTYVNEEAAWLLKKSPEELLGKQIWVEVFGDPIETNSVFYRELNRAANEQITLEFEDFSVTLNCWLEVRAYPSAEGLAVYFRDITDRKTIETEREQLLEREQNARVEAERVNRIKDEFLATLSHELRSPLNAIIGWSNLLRSRQLDQPTVTRALETIERNARSQAQLIEDLLDVSRIIQGQMRLNVRPVQLVQVIEAAIDTMRPAAEAKNIRLQPVLDPAAGPVSGDADRLQQVIWNLLTNAIKFTPKGGRVQIRLERINSHVEIKVTDTGQGISAEFLPHIFDRFRQADSSISRSFGGLGLGLAIVRQLVELHGGTVHAESPGEGKGATFMINLPLMAVLSQDQDPDRVHPTVGNIAPFESGIKLNGLRILVVDDEKDARSLIARVLEECGAAVTAVATASEAIAALTAQTEAAQFNVLVSDIGMPDEDGYALIYQVRALKPEQGGRIPAVALTAYARAEDRRAALLAGFQSHVAKPFEPADLIVVISSLAGQT